jgi:hypothetical protein
MIFHCGGGWERQFQATEAAVGLPASQRDRDGEIESTIAAICDAVAPVPTPRPFIQ